MNLYRACGRDFSSEEAFDRHRVGVHEYTFPEGLRFEPPRADGRRCLDVDGILALGWEKNAQGGWFDPERVARSRESLAASQNAYAKPTGAVAS